MKFKSTIQTNKRGQKYTTRSTRLANGFMKHYGNDKAKEINLDLLPLCVQGTFDKLAKQRFDIIWITVCHPVDKDYTKKVAILRKNRRKYIDRMPTEERNRIVYKKYAA